MTILKVVKAFKSNIYLKLFHSTIFAYKQGYAKKPYVAFSHGLDLCPGQLYKIIFR